MNHNELNQLIESNGITPAELSRRLRVSPAAVCRWLSGKRGISNSTKRKVVSAVEKGAVDLTPEEVARIRQSAEVMSRVVDVNLPGCDQWSDLHAHLKVLWSKSR